MEKIIIGSATMYLADCMEVLPTLGRVDAVITDPPYGLGKKLSGGSWGATADHQEVLVWDAEAPQHIIDQLIATYPTCVIWGGNYFVPPPSRGWMIWSKVNAVPTAADCEMAWTSLDRNTKQLRLPCEKHNSGHPTEKPLRLMSWCIEQIGNHNVIMDPFMGSGTTGVAAVQMGRSFIGIERDPSYFEVACRRIEQAQQQGDMFIAASANAPMAQIDLLV